MKNTRILVISMIAAAVALPTAAWAAKADKKKDNPPPSFSSVDKDSNGSVNEAEYVEAMKGALGEEGAKAKFASLDKDHDGKLTADEYGAGGTEKKKRKKKQD